MTRAVTTPGESCIWYNLRFRHEVFPPSGDSVVGKAATRSLLRGVLGGPAHASTLVEAANASFDGSPGRQFRKAVIRGIVAAGQSSCTVCPQPGSTTASALDMRSASRAAWDDGSH